MLNPRDHKVDGEGRPVDAQCPTVAVERVTVYRSPNYSNANARADNGEACEQECEEQHGFLPRDTAKHLQVEKANGLTGRVLHALTICAHHLGIAGTLNSVAHSSAMIAGSQPTRTGSFKFKSMTMKAISTSARFGACHGKKYARPPACAIASSYRSP